MKHTTEKNHGVEKISEDDLLDIFDDLKSHVNTLFSQSQNENYIETFSSCATEKTKKMIIEELRHPGESYIVSKRKKEEEIRND